MFTRQLKAPVLPTLLSSAVPVAPFKVWEGNCPIDMVCVCSEIGFTCVVLFGPDTDMPTVTTTTGFPIGTEPIVFTLGPNTTFMSMAPLNTLGRLSYYFVGQTDPNA